MAETLLEQYRRLMTEAKAVEPKPAIPIEGLSIDPGEEGGVMITTNAEGQEMNWHEVKLDSRKGLVFPSVTLTDAQMDAVCAYWTKAKTEVKL